MIYVYFFRRNGLHYLMYSILFLHVKKRGAQNLIKIDTRLPIDIAQIIIDVDVFLKVTKLCDGFFRL